MSPFEYLEQAKQDLLSIIEQSKKLIKRDTTKNSFNKELKTKNFFKSYVKSYAGKENVESRSNTFSYIVRDALFEPSFNINDKLVELESLLKKTYRENYPEDLKLKQQKTKEFEKDVRGTEKAESQAKKDFLNIFTSIGPSLEIEAKKSNNPRMFTAFLKSLSANIENPIGKFVNTYFEGVDNKESRVNTLLYTIRDSYFPPEGKKIPKSLKTLFDLKLSGIVTKSHKNKVLNEERSILEAVIPETFLKYLPTTLIVEVDKNSRITAIKSKFENKLNDLSAKIERQKDLLLNLTKLELKIKKDITSSDHDTKMKAIIIFLMLETGIRPGAEDNKIKNMEEFEEGEDDIDEYLETYGATTLNKNHINFIRENYVGLEFRGKKGTINLANISDAILIKAIKDIMDLDKKSEYLFLDSEGKIFDQPKVTAYLRNIIPGLNLTDFRKLKSTRVVLEALKQQEQNILNEIYKLTQDKVEDVKEQIIFLLEDAVEEAYQQSVLALSHQNINTTIKSYINPQVLLNFLSTGRVADRIEDVVLKEQNLRFDPEIFIKEALAYGSAIGELSNKNNIRTSSLKKIFYKFLQGFKSYSV